MGATEVVIFQVGFRYAWILRLANERTVIAEGVRDTFRLAALDSELAELRYVTQSGLEKITCSKNPSK